MAHPVVHFEIGTKDGERAATLYRELFGWEVAPAGPGYWLVSPQDTGIGGGLMEARDEIPPYVTVYVATEALEADLAKAVELGCTAIVPATPIHGVGRFAMFQDPDGNMISLIDALPEPPASQARG